MIDAETIEQIVEDAIDKHWLPFEFKFIEWEAEYKKKYLDGIGKYMVWQLEDPVTKKSEPKFIAV